MNSSWEKLACRRTALIGHRDLLPGDIGQRLKTAIQKQIDLGCRHFMVGTHGKFDEEALRACESLQKIYPDIKIQVVVTNIPRGQPNIPQSPGVELVMYEIEELHYKQRITASNRQMIAACDTLICYVRPNAWRSGAAAMLQYAVKKGLKIINLYA